nr:hypothetical protein [Propionibacterium sp.]
MDSNVATLLAHGGWEVVDPADLRSPAGDPLTPPVEADLARLAPGHGVKVVLGLATMSDGALAADPPYGPDGVPNLIAVAEQTWLFVVERRAEELTALLANTPAATHTRLRANTLLTVALDRVLEVTFEGAGDVEELRRRITAAGFEPQSEAEAVAPLPADAEPRLDPDQAAVFAGLDARPYPVHPASLVIIERDLDQRLPLVGRRDEPDPSRRDSGWVIQSARPDADPEADADRFGVLEAAGLRTFGPVWAHLALPPGWGFVIPPGGQLQIITPADLADAE